MTNMILEVYDAFRSIGIEEDAARKAAGALSNNPTAIAELRSDMNGEFAKVRSEMAGEFAKVRSEVADFRSDVARGFANVRSEMAAEFGKLRTEQVVVRTMLGILVAGVLSIVVKLYF